MKHWFMNHFIILAVALSLSACTAKFDEAAVGTGGTNSNPSGQDVNFLGITSISNATDSTLTLNWTAHPSAVAYDIYTVTA